MLRGLYTAYTGMLNEQYRMDIMSNNLANADTTGFKKEGSTSQAYDEVMAVKIKDLSENPNVPKRLGNMSLGVKIGETFTDFSQGSLRITENPYDLALGGDGFFNIEFTNKSGETSTKYTRDGGFTLTKEGWLVTKDGDYVLGENDARIQVSTTAAETVIDRMGNIYQETQKLLAYTIGRNVVAAKDIEAVCVKQLTNKIYDMVRAVADRNQGRRRVRDPRDIGGPREDDCGVSQQTARGTVCNRLQGLVWKG